MARRNPQVVADGLGLSDGDGVDESDAEVLRRLAQMVDLGYRGELTAAMAGEARMLEDRFGLSPISRRRLGWAISDAEVLDFTRPPAKRRLRAVDAKAKDDQL